MLTAAMLVVLITGNGRCQLTPFGCQHHAHALSHSTVWIREILLQPFSRVAGARNIQRTHTVPGQLARPPTKPPTRPSEDAGISTALPL